MSYVNEIDGSVLEGGGQILRMSVALSAILGIPIQMTNIRAGRSKPGLAAQHLKGIQLVAQMCGAKFEGAELGSTEIKFTPGKIRGGHYKINIETAGAISLLVQLALPCALLADGQVVLDLKGGTNVMRAPHIDYMTEVFRPILEKFGGTFDFDMFKRGYYPKGGGHVRVTVDPIKAFKAFSLMELGVVEKIYGWSFVSGTLPIKLAYQMANGAKQELSNMSKDINIDCYCEEKEVASQNCNGIILVSETSTGCVLGSDGLGQKNSYPYTMGRSVGKELAAALESGACLDQHAQDQVIIFMALAEGKSSFRIGEITCHTRTAIYIAERLTNLTFNVTETGEHNTIECVGMGYRNRNIQR